MTEDFRRIGIFLNGKPLEPLGSVEVNLPKSDLAFPVDMKIGFTMVGDTAYSHSFARLANEMVARTEKSRLDWLEGHIGDLLRAGIEKERIEIRQWQNDRRRTEICVDGEPRFAWQLAPFDEPEL